MARLIKTRKIYSLKPNFDKKNFFDRSKYPFDQSLHKNEMYIRNINQSGSFYLFATKSFSFSIKDTIPSCRNKDNINSVKEKKVISFPVTLQQPT